MLGARVPWLTCLALALAPASGCSTRHSAGDGGLSADAGPRWVRVEGTFPWYAHAATRLADGSVLLTGGHHSPSVPQRALRQTWRFDPSTNRLRLDEPMHYGRQAHGATLLSDGRVLVVGGFDADLLKYEYPWVLLAPRGAGAEIYDPSAAPGQRWRDLPNPITGFARGVVQQLASGEVFVATGSSWPWMGLADCCGGFAPAEFFDPLRETWRSGSEPSGELPYWPGRVAALLDEGSLFTFGGNRSDAVLRVSPVTGLPSLVARLQAWRDRAAAVPLGSGRYWVIGGMASSGEPYLSATAERVSSTGGATERVLLDDSFEMIRATRLPSGSALLFGGSRNSNWQGVLVGLLDRDGVYRRLQRLPFRGISFTATELTDGSVLLCGTLTATHGGDVGAVVRFYPGGL